MIGLDTNVILRYLIRDDDAQTERAAEWIERRLSSKNPGYIGIVTVLEFVWVLQSSYKYTPQQTAEFVTALLASEEFLVESEFQVHYATNAMKNGFDFADALIGALNTSAGCTKTLTFDRKASRLPGFELI